MVILKTQKTQWVIVGFFWNPKNPIVRVRVKVRVRVIVRVKVRVKVYLSKLK